jgi:hypothetical protein
MTHPVSIWDGSRRIAFFNDPANPLHANQELHVLRDDNLIGVVLITSVGILNAYGNFYSHIQHLELSVKDEIAVPAPDALPTHLPDRGLGRILYTSLAPDGRVWVVIDRGVKDGVDADTDADALLEGRKIGTVKILFSGRTLSYGLLDREAIVPLYKISESLIRFNEKSAAPPAAPVPPAK